MATAAAAETVCIGTTLAIVLHFCRAIDDAIFDLNQTSADQERI
jgi:hypothetical protein